MSALSDRLAPEDIRAIAAILARVRARMAAKRQAAQDGDPGQAGDDDRA
jgi:hypothetical protein